MTHNAVNATIATTGKRNERIERNFVTLACLVTEIIDFQDTGPRDTLASRLRNERNEWKKIPLNVLPICFFPSTLLN